MKETEPLSVTLSAGEWNHVLALMGKAPFEVCADLILKIRDQCLAQQQQAPPKPNGAGEADHAR